ESGRDGDFIFSPQEEPWEVPFDVYAKSYDEKLRRPVTESGWERSWLVTEADAIYGEIVLVHRPPLKSSLHRATLMMGIERSHRGRGLGPQLMTEAISWAKAQPTLEWLHLYVFENNGPARKLYKKFGFRENGITHDMFRVFGQQITD